MGQQPTDSQCRNGWLFWACSSHRSQSRWRNWVYRRDQRHGEAGSTAEVRKGLLKNDNIKTANPSTLPIGVGFLLFAVSLDEAIAVISRHLPAIIWLACPADERDFET